MIELLHGFRYQKPYHKARKRPNALYNMVFGPKSLKCMSPWSHRARIFWVVSYVLGHTGFVSSTVPQGPLNGFRQSLTSSPTLSLNGAKLLPGSPKYVKNGTKPFCKMAQKAILLHTCWGPDKVCRPREATRARVLRMPMPFHLGIRYRFPTLGGQDHQTPQSFQKP